MAKEEVKKKEELDFDMLDLFEDIVEKFPNDKKEVVETKEDVEDIIEKKDNDPDFNNNEEVEEEEKKQEDLDEEEENNNTSLLTPYAKFLVEEGIFSQLDINKFDGTAESLKKAQIDEINYHVTKIVDNYKSQMPAEIQRLLSGYEEGVPFDEMLKISSDRIRYKNITEDKLSASADLQKNILKDYLDKTTKFSDAMKAKMITQWEDSLELESQSKMALSELITHQDELEKEAIKQQKIIEEQEQKAKQETLARLDKYIISTEEVVPGLKINQVVKDKIKQNLTVPVGYDEYGNPMNKVGKFMSENPIEGEFILHYIFEITNGFKDWSLFGKSGRSQALKELEDGAKALDGKSSGNKRTNNKVDSRDIFDAIQGFKF